MHQHPRPPASISGLQSVINQLDKNICTRIRSGRIKFKQDKTLLEQVSYLEKDEAIFGVCAYIYEPLKKEDIFK
jgi:hypothetical protein